MSEKILFNDDWRFHRGEIDFEMPPYKGAAYMQAKTEQMLTGPAAYAYNDRVNDYRMSALYTSEKWENVTLPHDYVLLAEPKEEYNCGLGYFKYENAWYRKHFSLCEDDREKRIALYFEGIATESEVFINGCPVMRNFCGYTSFEVDITDFVKFDKENIVAVHTITSRHECWWYEGGGICRNVWLKKSSPLHITLYGVYAKTKKLDNESWEVCIETELENCFATSKSAFVYSNIYDQSGKELAKTTASVEISDYGKTTAKSTLKVKSPLIWSPDEPVLYSVKCEVYSDGIFCDSESVRIGFRTFEATTKGFFINGKKYKIKGVNAHEDFGITGRAVPENIHRYKIQMLKEMGANAYRCSHYPQNEAIMDALDESGFIVMAETRHFDSSAEGLKQLEMLIKRDRNHPSVFFWSLGNEEPKHRTDDGIRMFRRMRALVKKLDDTRLITSAVCAPPEKAPIMAELDVIGINYNLDMYDDARRLYPGKPFISTEYSATSTTRGWYKDDCPVRGYMSAYDKDTNSLFQSREFSWRFIDSADDILGGYQWDGFEHRGESLWPRLCSQAGAIDLFLRKKDAFYQNLSQWSKKPMIHILPHWNLPEKEGTPIKVVAYTNCEEAELFLGEASLGRQKVEKYQVIEWKVPYVDKKLTVIGYIGGEPIATDYTERTGAAVKLKLELDNNNITANGRDIALVACYAIDKRGKKVPNASCTVSFATNKLGEVVGTGSDVCDHNRVDLPIRRMREGVCVAAIKVGNATGILKVYAETDGLIGDALEIILNGEQ
ncbi:MAG: glycoside hydrolase family 2 protein [Ruminococcaceae bacterium]|nr:glycoside hydrolase family 2 protein [Oscillospiraceae bacterium]